MEFDASGVQGIRFHGHCLGYIRSKSEILLCVLSFFRDITFT